MNIVLFEYGEVTTIIIGSTAILLFFRLLNRVVDVYFKNKDWRRKQTKYLEIYIKLLDWIDTNPGCGIRYNTYAHGLALETIFRYVYSLNYEGREEDRFLEYLRTLLNYTGASPPAKRKKPPKQKTPPKRGVFSILT